MEASMSRGLFTHDHKSYTVCSTAQQGNCVIVIGQNTYLLVRTTWSGALPSTVKRIARREAALYPCYLAERA